MDRPSVHTKSLRTGSVSTVLASALFVVTVLAPVGLSQAPQGGDEASAQVRRTIQYLISQGTQQYQRGSYAEADKTFQLAQGYAEYLEPAEQRQLESLRQEGREPVADIEEGHISSAACILANLASKIGRTVQLDTKTGEVVGDAEANRLLLRPYRKPWVHPATVWTGDIPE